MNGIFEPIENKTIDCVSLSTSDVILLYSRPHFTLIEWKFANDTSHHQRLHFTILLLLLVGIPHSHRKNINPIVVPFMILFGVRNSPSYCPNEMLDFIIEFY